MNTKYVSLVLLCFFLLISILSCENYGVDARGFTTFHGHTVIFPVHRYLFTGDGIVTAGHAGAVAGQCKNTGLRLVNGFIRGGDLIIEIPPGTLIKDAETGDLLKDFTQPDESFIVAKGGRGGQGNCRFKTSTHRAPRFAQPGEPGQFLKLKLELKLIADVGLIGLPNAGKSTLISAISSATPKIADYPFTTLTPNLGVVQTGWGKPFVVADIPGLIEGAHNGAGLGIRFLRHIERTHILVHLVDASAIDLQNPLAGYETINGELAGYSPQLAEKPQILVLNKMDLPGTDQTAKILQTMLKDREVLLISAVTREGVEQLISKIIERLDQFHNDEQ